MLENLNNYAHGYVAIPVILACGKHGLFDLLDTGEPRAFGDLRASLGANEGHLRAALALLESLGWVSNGSADSYVKTGRTGLYSRINPKLPDLLSFPADSYVLGRDRSLSLSEWIQASGRRWDVEDPVLSEFQDGILAIPLLLALKQNRLLFQTRDNQVPGFVLQDYPAAREITEFFVNRGWLAMVNGSLIYTDAGRFMAERCYITATVSSYRPMLANISQALFGDCKALFARDASGYETHVDRGLNVRGSGFQHERYFADLEETIIAIFDHGEPREQPRYVADMGCGDGSLLKRIHKTIQEKTLRGRVLGEYPVKLIGLDFNEQALEETSLTLQGLDHIVMRADIGDPEQMIKDLRVSGIEDPDAILHVRSFLDHDRPYRPPIDAVSAAARERFGGKCVCVDRDGKAISPGAAVQSLVEHLKRWSPVLGAPGLAVLEVHCLDPRTVAGHLDKCESLHFDAYHRFSRQLLVEADQFVMAAAEVGLIPRANGSKRYPKVFPFTRITLNHFQRRPYRIRYATAADLDALLALEDAVGCGRSPVSRAEIVRRLEAYPGGQCVMEAAGRVIGAAYTQRIAISPDEVRREQGDRPPWRHVAHGATVELFEAIIDPTVDSEWVGEFMEFVSRWSGLKPGVESVIGQSHWRRIPCDRPTRSTPAASSLTTAVERFVAHYPLDLKQDPAAPERELEAFGTRLLLGAFKELGVLRAARERMLTPAEIVRGIGIQPKYERLFAALLKMLERGKMVSLAGGHVMFARDVERLPPGDVPRETEDFRKSFCSRHPDFEPFLRLMLRCMEFYPDVLIGRTEANDVVFPGGTMELFAGIFKGNRVADYFNELVAEVVGLRVNGLAGHPPRILEIGAGTGGTTIAVLKHLERLGRDVSFFYTDISSTFVRAGERAFAAGRSWMRFDRLNIEEDLPGQGFEPGSFEIIYSANVLHDTKRMSHTLAQVRALLKPGGLLVLNEYTQMKDLLLLTGGLLHGWWLFEDPECRLKDTCLLSIPLWQSLLTEGGFTECRGYGLPFESDLGAARQGVILGIKPEPGARPAPASAGKLDELVRAAILEIIGEKRMAAFSADLPLMELGLDSLEVLELRTLIGKKLGVELGATFLFQQNTAAKIVEFFARDFDLDRPKPSVSAVEPASIPPPERPRMNGVRSTEGGVAVIGLALRFPGGIRCAADYWSLLKSGRSAIRELPAGRWIWPPGVDIKGSKAHLAKGGYLDRIDQFDAQFFRLSPKESELLDPQQRLLLELAWEAMENAGRAPSGLRTSNTGVYIGACHFDYRGILEQAGGAVDAMISTGTAGSILANRLSYFYDFHGPSILFDTACSSSLVAISEAVRAVRGGSCELALAGGVNLICSPTNTLAYDHAQMLSTDGESYPFDFRARGYVRGEGGALVLLKDLDAARRDGDPIYGVIRGVSVNHGGEASSLTAPNPAAQARVIAGALEDAGFAADTIGYVEAHGTGTPLGDPIEVEGLNQAFSGLAGSLARTQYCGLGSVKSSLGHLEGAAGIAGFIKVLLCLQNGAIPPSRNYQKLNPEIRLGEPFYIADTAREWRRLSNESGTEIPRRGGVSAFGFGGSNAHVVLEEFVETPTLNSTGSVFVVPFSARDPETLDRVVRQSLDYLRNAIDAGGFPGLADYSHTLQAGRDAMTERLAVVVSDPGELRRKLEFFCSGSPGSGQWFRGSGKRDSGVLDLLDDPARDDLVRRLVSQRDYQRLAQIWVAGLNLNWKLLYQETKPRLVHLPAYPFSGDGFWAPKTDLNGHLGAADPVSTPHPLLQKEDSSTGRCCFTSVFDGSEFFLADHLVHGRRVFPGAAYLEMVRAGAERFFGLAKSGGPVIRVTEVVWSAPMIAGNQPIAVRLTLSRNGGTAARFEISSDCEVGAETVHCCGLVTPGNGSPGARLDLAGVRETCGGELDDVQFYPLFDGMGINYGSAHRAVVSFFPGRECGLAKLILPRSAAGMGGFSWHPGMLDSALQAGIFLLRNAGDRRTHPFDGPLLPFALEEFEVFGACRAEMWAIPRIRTGGKASLLDLDLCDGDGNLCARLKGLVTRPQKSGRATAPIEVKAIDTAPALLSLLCPVWDPIVSRGKAQSLPLTDRITMVGGTETLRREIETASCSCATLEIGATDSVEAIAGMLKLAGKIDHILWVAPGQSGEGHAGDRTIAAQRCGVLLCFRLVKALLGLGYGSRNLKWTFITRQTQRVGRDDLVDPVHASLHGLAGSMAKEYPNWRVLAIDLEAAKEVPVGEWLDWSPGPDGETIANRAGQWYRQDLIPLETVPTTRATPYRRGGVYVVIGGAGGIGAVWSEWMITRWDARIIWIGRRPEDAAIREKIRSLAKLGTPPVYLSADASDQAALQSALTAVKSRYPEIHGIVHSALVLSDQSLANMDEARFAAVLSAKVDVSVRIAQVFRNEPLDFVLFFSSIAAFARAAGQSNYASGCAFKDAFAARLSREWPCLVRVVNWGYWGGVGAVASPQYRELMAAEGIASIEPAEGMAALDELLSGTVDQLAIMKLTGGVA